MEAMPNNTTTNPLRHNQLMSRTSNIEEELRETVQHLAIQNMHLFNELRGVEKILNTTIVHQVSDRKNFLTIPHETKECCVQTDGSEEAKEVFAIDREISDEISAIVQQDVEGTSSIIELEITEEELDEAHAERNKTEMEKFKEDLGNKREARHRAISAVSAELERLRGELNEEKETRMKAEAELKDILHNVGKSTDNEELNTVREEMAKQNEKHAEVLKRLEDENSDLSNRLKEETFKSEADREYSQRRVGALKEVAALSKQMLLIRENQVADLKTKITHLETSPSENAPNTQLQAEYDIQINNIKSLKSLYEDRLKSVTAEKDKFRRECEDKSEELEAIIKKCSELETRLAELEKSAEEREELNLSLQTRLDLSLEESKGLSKEISLINSTFTQMLVGNRSPDLDLDKLTKRLQENHDLITEMTTKEDGSGSAASLPKLLLDLINQIDDDETAVASTSGVQNASEDVNQDIGLTVNDSSSEKDKAVQEDSNNSLVVEEIASNLPKVWRVLMELLSHHIVPPPTEDNKPPSCYKSIETPTGTQLVPSVSNTYIRLKDLILEKKSLQKDLGKLKQLNGHLESKLQEQEKRLLLVTAELRKTWSVVGRLRSQFKQLHTHEQILRYELQQKRHLLTELKNELEYCREKWERARQKDRETEVEWKKLRKEFAARKQQDRNNSAESGFSDERETESTDEEIIVQTIQTSVITDDSACTSYVAIAGSCDTKQDIKERKEEKKTPKDEHVPSSSNISWMTLLKLFRCENRGMLLETDLMAEAAALESIFCLPPITVPEHLIGNSLNVDENVKQISTKPLEPSEQSPIPTTSGIDTRSRDALGRTPEEALAARSARLKRLEEQTQMLFKKVTRTTNRSVELSNRLEELHEQYGIPNPPPLPQTLPILRIPLQQTDNNTLALHNAQSTPPQPVSLDNTQAMTDEPMVQVQDMNTDDDM